MRSLAPLPLAACRGSRGRSHRSGGAASHGTQVVRLRQRAAHPARRRQRPRVARRPQLVRAAVALTAEPRGLRPGAALRRLFVSRERRLHDGHLEARVLRARGQRAALLRERELAGRAVPDLLPRARHDHRPQEQAAELPVCVPAEPRRQQDAREAHPVGGHEGGDLHVGRGLSLVRAAPLLLLPPAAALLTPAAARAAAPA